MVLERFDVVVAGAGVIGLAIARALSLAGRQTLVVEAEGTIGSATSSRNSEVIHAGLYYPPGSLKAQLCVEGRERLYRFCADRGISHRRLGKLIVATDTSQESKLERLVANGEACAVRDLALISAAEARALEPRLHCVRAILSPSTGIIDSHGLMLALQGEAEAHSAQFVFNTKIERAELAKEGVIIRLNDLSSQERFSILAHNFINATGLNAPEVADLIDGFPKAAIPRAYFARGCYFGLKGASPFSRLIYPIPVEGGLGVHLTLDLAGAARFGPDVEWIESVDYRVDPSRANAFYAEIRRYWPELQDDALTPGYSGVRPKISGPGESAADFRIDGPRQHGVPGVVNLFGFESPGLTASLAIADKALEALGG